MQHDFQWLVKLKSKNKSQKLEKNSTSIDYNRFYETTIINKAGNDLDIAHL